MNIIIWLLIGMAAGAVAKRLTPQAERATWVSSLIIGVIGSLLGGFLFGLIGITTSTWIGSFIFALIGSVIFLYIYHRYLASKIDLGV